MIRDFAVVTERVSHYYVDNASGNDANNGRTLATAKKTLAGVQAILPDIIKHNSYLHLSGVFSEQALVLNQEINAGCYFVVDGGSSLDTVAGPFAISNSATTYVTTATPGWTTDQYVGYWIKITGGAADGQLRHIHSNTTDTAYQNYPWSVAPEVGVAQFSIVRPATTLTGTSADVVVNVATKGIGELVLQRLRVHW